MFSMIKVLMIEAYRPLQQWTNMRIASFSIAFTLITILMLTNVYSLVAILSEFGMTGLLGLLRTRNYLIAIVAIVTLNIIVVQPLSDMMRERKRTPKPYKIILYAIASIIIFAFALTVENNVI